MDAKTTQPDAATELGALRARVAELEAARSQRDQAQAALRESEQLYRKLVETSPDSIVLADVHGRIIMANQQAAGLHGFPGPQDMLSMNVLDLVAAEYRAQASADICRIVETGELRDRQHELLRGDGRSFTAEVTGSLIRNAEGQPKYIIYNGRDVTGRLRLQREMVERQKLESIGTLAGGIAHDFNNLLAVILGNASMQLRNIALPPKTLDSLKDIVEAAERASSLTTQLLAYARGGLRKPVRSELNRIVQAACDILRPTLPRQISLTLNLAESLPPITVDQSQIQQVIINLCMNAIQATSAPGQVWIRTRSEEIDRFRAESLRIKPGRYVALVVEDHGTGMDDGTIERVFEPFFTTRPESRGMGLPASLGIVQSHRGGLMLDSEPGRGTTATVWLPATPQDCEQSSPVQTVVNAPQGNETILIVDPDPAVSRVAEQILASLGYCVVARNDGDEAMAFLATHCEEVDLILLNVGTPTRSGGPLLEMVRRKCENMPIVLTSGHGQADNGNSPEASATGFLPKPFCVLSLAQAVRKALDNSVRPRPEADEQ